MIDDIDFEDIYRRLPEGKVETHNVIGLFPKEWWFEKLKHCGDDFLVQLNTVPTMILETLEELGLLSSAHTIHRVWFKSKDANRSQIIN